MTANFVDNVKFSPTAGGTTDWTFSAASSGYQSPSLAGITNGAKYKHFAISADLSQWEITEGTYNTGTGVLARTTVLYNSSGTGTATGQSGAGTKINFTTVPTVAIIAAAEDMVPQTIGQLPGTATNDNASAGNVGEYIIGSLAFGSATALTNNTPKTVASITLSGGDWELEGLVQYTGAGSTVITSAMSIISDITNSLPTGWVTVDGAGKWVGSATGDSPFVTSGRKRISVASGGTPTYFLIALAFFSVSTMSAAGSIRARRVR